MKKRLQRKLRSIKVQLRKRLSNSRQSNKRRTKRRQLGKRQTNRSQLWRSRMRSRQQLIRRVHSNQGRAGNVANPNKRVAAASVNEQSHTDEPTTAWTGSNEVHQGSKQQSKVHCSSYAAGGRGASFAAADEVKVGLRSAMVRATLPQALPPTL